MCVSRLHKSPVLIQPKKCLLWVGANNNKGCTGKIRDIYCTSASEPPREGQHAAGGKAGLAGNKRGEEKKRYG